MTIQELQALLASATDRLRSDPRVRHGQITLTVNSGGASLSVDTGDVYAGAGVEGDDVQGAINRLFPRIAASLSEPM